MYSHSRLSIVLVLALAFTSSAAFPSATLYRDRFGVPSIQSDRLPDAFYGLGYAMAQDSAEQMARSYKLARGRMAEVDGKSALLADGFLRSLGIEEMAEKKAGSDFGEPGQLIRGFCEGANRALAEQKGKIPAWIEPFTPVDILALAQMANAAFPLQSVARQLMPGMGSNQFAVAGKRSSTGHAILSIDPHLPWSGMMAWYEFGLYTPDFNFRGITFTGLPFGAMGHTDHVAWCMTNNDPDLYDFFTVQTNPSNPKQYSFHGEWREYEETTFELKWIENGEMKSRKQTARRTAWGPMVPLRAQAVAFSMLDSWESLEQPLRMARAKTTGEFREAIRTLGLSMWNIVYADIRGEIGYQFYGRVPRRDESFDWSKPVSGADPRTRWGALLTIDELPHVENPKSGLLVNANSAPWLTPIGPEIRREGWPTYVTTYGPTTRSERLVELLRSDTSISTGEAKRYAVDTQVPDALAAVRALRTAAKRLDGPEETGAMLAIDILAKWNGRADVNSVGCAIYAYWVVADKKMEVMARAAAQGRKWTAEQNTQALATLSKAAGDLMKHFGKMEVSWGEVHVKQRGTQSAPVLGYAYLQGSQPGVGSIAAVAPNFGPFKDGKWICDTGSSFRMIVDLDPKGVRSWSALPYGASQNPDNPHYADQMGLHGRGEYKDTLFGLARIKKAAISTKELEVR